MPTFRDLLTKAKAEITEIDTATRLSRAIAASKSISSHTRADLVVIVTGWRISAHTSSTCGVSR